MRPSDRRLPWMFLIAFTAATIAQGVGAKFVVRLVGGSLPPAGVAGLAILVGAYGLLIIGLVRMLRGTPAGDDSRSPGPTP